MLVGHSQGGTVALQAAGGMAGSDRFDLTHVLTAGANGSQVTVPGAVHVLSLENVHDIVPNLDGRTNPDGPNWTTMTVDATNTHKIGDNHGINQVYLDGAHAADVSTDPSVVDYRDSASIFLGTNRVDPYIYDVSRQ